MLSARVVELSSGLQFYATNSNSKTCTYKAIVIGARIAEAKTDMTRKITISLIELFELV
jgi:hypothetical protein